MSGFNNAVVGGDGTLVRDSIHSPNYVAGVAGWSINKDGTAQFNELTLIVQTDGQAILIYNGSAASGNLIGSWAASSGIDPYGNPYPAGINVVQGSLSGVNLTAAAMAASTIQNTLISASQMQSSQINGGNIYESIITFDSSGGGLFMYSTTTSQTTFTTDGTYTATATGNARVQCWGSGAGGGGGNTTQGGEAGGAGEYAEEPDYPVVGGDQYLVSVGQGGNGGNTNNAGEDGDTSAFDNFGVVAWGGQAGGSGFGGFGGGSSTNSIEHPGGNGGNASASFTGGAGGGAAAGTTNTGANGNNNSGSSGATGGTGTNGGGNGGNGGASTANGNNGVFPGGAGGGAGAAPGGTSVTKSYRPTQTGSYFGSEVGQNRRNTNGAMYQGCASGEINTTGDQYSIALYNKSQIASDFSGATITGVTVEVTNSHSWFNSGQYLVFGYANFGSLGPVGNLTGAHLNSQSSFISEGGTKTFSTPFLKSPIQGGTFNCLILGPSKSTSGGAQSLWNYGFQNGGSSFGPILKISGNTGAGTASAGDGADGQVIVTQTSTSQLVGALSPIIQTDTAGNQVAIGYTGPTTAIQPSSSPALPESWHYILNGTTGTAPTGTTSNANNFIRYKLLAETNMAVINFNIAGSFAPNVNIGTVPTGYRPAKQQLCELAIAEPTAPTSAGPRTVINASGTFSANWPNGTATSLGGVCLYPLD